jgi:hypothetical protein
MVLSRISPFLIKLVIIVFHLLGCVAFISSLSRNHFTSGRSSKIPHAIQSRSRYTVYSLCLYGARLCSCPIHDTPPRNDIQRRVLYTASHLSSSHSARWPLRCISQPLFLFVSALSFHNSTSSVFSLIIYRYRYRQRGRLPFLENRI